MIVEGRQRGIYRDCKKGKQYMFWSAKNAFLRGRATFTKHARTRGRKLGVLRFELDFLWQISYIFWYFKWIEIKIINMISN